MRRTLRLLASVKPARYLEPGAPTGLTGLQTHNTPRSTLIFFYNSTLEKLQAFPEHSVYRQSVEALTKHRLAVVEATRPAGYADWLAKARALLDRHPEQFTMQMAGRKVDGHAAWTVSRGGKTFVVQQAPLARDVRELEWDGEVSDGAELEGARTEEERKGQVASATRRPVEDVEKVEWIHEPALTAEQISEIENKIGAGLIEEVIQVAESENKLVDIMLKSKVWETLEEKPAEGQWTYFDRKS